jgi:hypothetical protein
LAKNSGFPLWVCTNVVGMISGLTGKNQGVQVRIYMYVKKVEFLKEKVNK